MRKATCPECGKPGEKVHTEERVDGMGLVYVCNNDGGFILPDCNVAQWTTHFEEMGARKEIDMTKVEAVA